MNFGQRALATVGARNLFYQVLAVGAVAALFAWLALNTVDNLEKRNISTGFGFLEREAGMEIGESAIEYAPSDSYGRAFVVGLLNTLRVALIGIALASVIGLFVGLARLSRNWLVARMALAYVETLRNVPLLLQLFFWYALITEAAPAPREALNPLPGVFLSARGLQVPALETDPVHRWAVWAFLAGAVACWLLLRRLRALRERTGNAPPAWPLVAALLVAPPAAILGLSGASLNVELFGTPLSVVFPGAPLGVELPEFQRFNFRGGTSLTPEFAALLLGLTLYTASFIAEIVRSGIQAIPRGQWEAARALGLRPGRVMKDVILPQALRVIIPPLTSQYLNLTKNSSLAVAIAYPDLVSIANVSINQTGQAIECIAIIMAVYLAISLAISLAMNLYNRAVALVER